MKQAPTAWVPNNVIKVIQGMKPPLVGLPVDTQITTKQQGAFDTPLYSESVYTEKDIAAWGCFDGNVVHFVSTDRNECVEESHRDGSLVVPLGILPLT